MIHALNKRGELYTRCHEGYKKGEEGRKEEERGRHSPGLEKLSNRRGIRTGAVGGWAYGEEEGSPCDVPT